MAEYGGPAGYVAEYGGPAGYVAEYGGPLATWLSMGARWLRG